MNEGRRSLVLALLFISVVLPFSGRWSSDAEATTTPTGPLTVTMPSPVTARVTVDPSSPVVAPVPIDVTQYYTAWPSGWPTSTAPSLTATVALTGTVPGELVLDQTGLTVTVTSSTPTSIRTG